MRNPLISIVVPVNNATLTLAKCVNSLTLQTFKNIEILLINNVSTDASWSLCLDLASKDSRVKAINHFEKGVSSASNRGILESVGKYVMFVDADDLIAPDICEKFANLNAEYDYDLFCFSAQYHKGKKTLKSFLFADNIDLLSKKQKEELQIKVLAPNAPYLVYKTNTRYVGSVWGKFYKRELLLKNNLCFAIETIISEDVLFNTLALECFDRIGYTRECFYHYIQQTNSAQNRYRPHSARYFAFVIKEIQSWLLKTNKPPLFVDAANSLFVHYLFGILKEDVFHKDNPDPNEVKKHRLNEVLSMEEFWIPLNNLNKCYFSLPERVLIRLLQKKWIGVVSFLFGLIR